MARLRVGSLIRKEQQSSSQQQDGQGQQKQQYYQYYLKKQTEKRNRGNTHEVPIFEISACLFQLWKKEREREKLLLLLKKEGIMSMWITKKWTPARPNKMIEKMKGILKEFNPCLQITPTPQTHAILVDAGGISTGIFSTINQAVILR